MAGGRAGTDLRDISAHPAFDDGGRPGTYGYCTARNKLDYVLLSPALLAVTTGGGIVRRGVWGGSGSSSARAKSSARVNQGGTLRLAGRLRRQRPCHHTCASALSGACCSATAR